jgi:hypothetical protein
MQACVYNGPGRKNLEDRAKPRVEAPTDAGVRITRTTICGTELHLLKGDVATCQRGTVLGHEGVSMIDSGPRVSKAARSTAGSRRVRRSRSSALGRSAEQVMKLDRGPRPRHRHRGGHYPGHVRALRRDRGAGRHRR